MNSELRWEKAKPHPRSERKIPLAIPINQTVFMVRLQPHCHLDFLTLTFISESFPNIGSQLNPSFHLPALLGMPVLGEMAWNFWRGRNVMWGRARRNPGNSCVTWSYKRKKTSFAWKSHISWEEFKVKSGTGEDGQTCIPTACIELSGLPAAPHPTPPKKISRAIDRLDYKERVPRGFSKALTKWLNNFN